MKNKVEYLIFNNDQRKESLKDKDKPKAKPNEAGDNHKILRIKLVLFSKLLF